MASGSTAAAPAAGNGSAATAATSGDAGGGGGDGGLGVAGTVSPPASIRDGAVVAGPTLRLTERSCTADIVGRVLDYLARHAPGAAQDAAALAEWDAALADAPDETLFQTVMAANFLGVDGLVELMCKKVADELKKCKTPDDIRARFNIRQDYTPVPLPHPTSPRRTHIHLISLPSPASRSQLRTQGARRGLLLGPLSRAELGD